MGGDAEAMEQGRVIDTPRLREQGRALCEGSVARTLDVLEFLARRSTPAPAAIVAASCGIPRSSLYALLRTLRSRRFVIYHGENRTWGLGPAAHELSDAAPLFVHGLAVLRAFASATHSLTPREIATCGELPRSIVERVLPFLEESDFLHLDSDGRYSLGLELVSLASRVASVDSLRIVSRAHLARLRDATQETANLIIRDGEYGLVVDVVESRFSLRISSWLGKRVPFEGTATGAAFTDGSTSHVAHDSVEVGVTAIACSLDVPEHDAVISILAPSWRLKEFGEERARLMVEAVAREIASRVRR
jgi:IclR family acetate operon transcriptional repressor